MYIQAMSSYRCNDIHMQVDVALECARLQHRLTLPPLEVEDFPQDVSLDTKLGILRSIPNEVDILQEFLSVATASQELINGSTSSYPEMWLGASTSSASYVNELSSLVEMGGVGTSNHHESARLQVEIADMEVFKDDKKRVENLRGVKLVNNDLGEVIVCIIPIQVYSHHYIYTTSHETDYFHASFVSSRLL